MMELLLKRLHKTDKSTVGELFIDGKFECYTLEDVEREVKIYGKTAIKKGKYDVIINVSNRFKVEMPLLLKVPEFEGIRIHSGNKPEDTLGCILVGETRSLDWVGSSKKAYKKLFAKMKLADKITIEIV
jgi:hypothetical protein